MPDTLEAIAQQIRSGDISSAQRAIGEFKPNAENRTELSFLQGYLKELNYEREEALATYLEVLADDPDHTESAFRAALLLDQSGDDETAMEYYERCTSHPPAHVHAMLNLAVLYEEHGRLDEAKELVQGVLDEHPNDVRAARLLKSIENSYTMIYDDYLQRERDSHSAILDVPIADFELSVRSRNCLKQMNIRSLGDLLRTSEAQLLAYRNFGETSLNEIKAMLNQRGLSLGQGVAPAESPTPAPSPPQLSEDKAVQLRRPIAELELSVRSRKCLQRLGVSTLEELVSKSEAELLGIKNFGMTSLTEIKQQLANFGLSLKAPTL